MRSVNQASLCSSSLVFFPLDRRESEGEGGGENLPSLHMETRGFQRRGRKKRVYPLIIFADVEDHAEEGGEERAQPRSGTLSPIYSNRPRWILVQYHPT